MIVPPLVSAETTCDFVLDYLRNLVFCIFIVVQGIFVTIKASDYWSETHVLGENRTFSWTSVFLPLIILLYANFIYTVLRQLGVCCRNKTKAASYSRADACYAAFSEPVVAVSMLLLATSIHVLLVSVDNGTLNSYDDTKVPLGLMWGGICLYASFLVAATCIVCCTKVSIKYKGAVRL